MSILCIAKIVNTAVRYSEFPVSVKSALYSLIFTISTVVFRYFDATFVILGIFEAENVVEQKMHNVCKTV
jgi:hypothetical protein